MKSFASLGQNELKMDPMHLKSTLYKTHIRSPEDVSILEQYIIVQININGNLWIIKNLIKSVNFR